MQKRLLFQQLTILCVLWLVQLFATYMFARTDNNMFFSPLHVLGGMWAASFGAWAFGFVGKHLSFAGYLLTALAFGVAWELFEAFAHLVSPGSLSYAVDTTTDLMFDVLGGYFVALVARKFMAQKIT